MRTVYLGTSAFAVDVLEALAASPHRPVLVVTPPDRPRGRGQRLSPTPVALAARRLGLELVQAVKVSTGDALQAIDAARPDAICVCAFGQLITEPLLSRYLILNVHPSLLPRWRGAAPIERTLMAGDAETGVTIFRIGEGLDSGPIVLAASEPVHPADTAGTLAGRLARLGARLLLEALDQAEAGALELVEQSEEGVTYAEKIGAAERRLDPSRPAAELERRVRALHPHVGAYLPLAGGGRLGVEQARAVEVGPKQEELRAVDGRVLVGCVDGALELLRVRPPGKRSMSAGDYLRGHWPPERVEP